MKTPVFFLLIQLCIFQAQAQLTFVEELTDGGKDQNNNTINGLDRAYGIVVSPDDRYLYVAAIDDNSISQYERNLATGTLTLVETLVAGGTDIAGNTINGLLGAINLDMTDDGTFIYVAGLGNNITAFARDMNSGRLTFVDALFTGDRDVNGNLVEGMVEAGHVDVSPDGRSVYVSARAGAGSVTVFHRNVNTGRLSFVENLVDGEQKDGVELNGIRKAYGLRVTPDNKFLYVASNIERSIGIFRRNPATSALTLVDVLIDGETDQDGLPFQDVLTGVNNLFITPDNEFIYFTAVSGDGVSVFGRNKNTGGLSLLQYLENGAMSGGRTITGLDGPQVAHVTPSRVYVGTAVAKSVVVFERNPSTGLMTFIESQVDDTGDINFLNDPEGLTVSRDNRFVYASGDVDNGLVVFRGMDMPLPVELVYFEGKLADGKALLSWETASEWNNKGFHIQRASEVGQGTKTHWKTVGFVQGKANSNSTQNYYFQDLLGKSPNNYYRLLQEDFDGSLHPSKMVVVQQKATQSTTLYPNPTQNIIYFTPSQHPIELLSFYNEQGDLAYQIQPNADAIDITHLPAATYFVTIKYGNSTDFQILVKQ